MTLSANAILAGASKYNISGAAAGIIKAYSGSLYLPNDANCFQDSAGTTPATKDSVVGKLLDSVGTKHATQGTTGFKPFLRKGAKNLLRYSEQFDNAAWTNSNATITANTVVSPDGTLDADKLVEDTSNSTHAVEQARILTASTTYSMSVYAKAAERTRFRLYGRISASWNVFTAGFFDLSTGTVISSSGDAAATITSVGNGWYRCTIYGTTTSTGTNAGIGLNTVQSGVTNSYTGNGTSGIYIWGAQLEAGSTASTYVATTSAPASNGIGPWWLDFDGSDDVLAAGAFGAGFASSTIIRANYGAEQTTTTAQDLSAGYNMTVDNSGLIVVPDTVSAADLAVLQRYANSLGGYSA